jgi:hypothetical protein
MAAANVSQPAQKSSNVVPMNVRAPQPPLPRNIPAPPSPSENHPPDEPGYGHGV